MCEIEKMKRYIERTHMKKADNYCFVYGEAIELLRTATDINGIFDVISLAFNYGKAKGYRAAKAKMKEAIT